MLENIVHLNIGVDKAKVYKEPCKNDEQKLLDTSIQEGKPTLH